MDEEHKGILIALLLKQFRKKGYLSGNKMSLQMGRDLEDISDEIVRFFTEPDSFSEDRLFSKPEGAVSEIDWMPKAVFSSTYDKKETDAAKRADQGDFFPLAELLEKRGYLRTTQAREVVSRKLKGINKKGAPKSEIHRQRFEQVGSIQIREKCTWAKAKEIWLDGQEPKISIETLNSSIKRMKTENPELTKLFKMVFKNGSERA